jgi:hypothetical protein
LADGFSHQEHFLVLGLIVHKTGNLLQAYLIVKHLVEIMAIMNLMRRYSLETQILGTIALWIKQAIAI